MNNRSMYIRMAFAILASFIIVPSADCQSSSSSTGEISNSIRKANEPPRGMSDSARENWAPLGLPRLRHSVPLGQAVPLGSNSYFIDPLERNEAGHERQNLVERDGIRILEIGEGYQWVRPLLWSNPTSFISVQIYATLGTRFRIGGQSFKFDTGPLENGGTLYFKNPEVEGWMSSGVHIRMEEFEGRRYAALPIITVRYSPIESKWDAFFGATRKVSSMPIHGELGMPNTIEIEGGRGGAWVSGLVQSIENPLFEDADKNGVADEMLSDKSYLSKTARLKATPVLLYERLKPDRIKEYEKALSH